jgi:hypothetical protein
MKTLFSIAAALTGLLGVSWLFFPTPMLSGWGVHGDGVAVYMARRYGGLFFGYCVILWLSRAAPASGARTAILAGSLVVTSVMAVVSLIGVVTGTVGPMAWSAVVVEALLAAGFAYFYVTAR